MRRADRLIELIGHLRQDKLVIADELARRLEVSVRTVYRDIVSLQAQGFPIEGQAGVGYLLRGPVDLPPLTFDHDQLEALALGLAYVAQVGDPALSAAARAAQAKIDAVWTGRSTPGGEDRRLRASQRPERRAPAFAAALRGALRARKLVAFRYTDADGKRTEREVRPLALTAFSEGWLLIAWCGLRHDFRAFRLDRVAEPVVLEAAFTDEPGRDLASYLEQFAASLDARMRPQSF
ncbi:helix-turn-helix transcriptional regulator [Chelatococcus reniformis]|uniref:DNA-binding transcriptional regulator n=1 Tax=Chelatococcus reniformis TaxID=1494448 RepID=A0A916UBG4_9HYPH|nr:YafY family protein [Chelatococcus reniformis]GGC66909.1 DNA-binding transcriptional regulator [Chelatococcus reniformis]